MKNAEYYLNLPYTVILRRDEEGDIVARVDELPGCAAHGKTEHEALENLQEAKELWITDCLEQGDPVPEPFSEDELPSGKWVQRVPRSLHKRLVEFAKREKVSLNQLTTSILSEAVGQRKTIQEFPTQTPFVPRQFLHAHLQKGAASLRPEPWIMDDDWHIKQTQSRPKIPTMDVVGIFRRRLPNQLEIKESKHGQKQEKRHERRSR